MKCVVVVMRPRCRAAHGGRPAEGTHHHHEHHEARAAREAGLRAREALVDRLAGLLPEEALQDALKGLEADEITGPGGLLTQLAVRVIETALDAELTEHVGHPSGGRAVGRERPQRRRPQDAANRPSDWPPSPT